MSNNQVPTLGEQLYIPKIDHGMCGGLATIATIDKQGKSFMVTFKEIGDSTRLNYKFIMLDQEKIKADYNGKIASRFAHPF